MESPLRGLVEHEAGTRDFDPKITLSPLDRANGIPEAEPDAESSDGRSASLYDAIRGMSMYESEIAAERRRTDRAGIPHNR